jgi:hypothetical protein
VNQQSQRKKELMTRRSLVALVLTLFVICALIPGSSAPGQTPPGYSALFQDSPRTDQLTQADLPNLGRLVVLEATSMFVHARSELSDSPTSYRLLADINTLWNAADAFTAAVAYYPLEWQNIEAGRLTLPDLEAAFNQVRATFGVLPGGAWRASEDLLDMSRVMAVIGPLLSQAQPPPTAPETPPPATQGELVAAASQQLAAAIDAFRRQLAGKAPANRPGDEVSQDLGTLAQLVAGLERVAAQGASEGEIVSSLRPLRSLAQRIDLELQRPGADGISHSRQWRPIQQQIDDLASQFQLPRIILVPAARARPADFDPALLASLDEAARDLAGAFAQALSDPAPTATAAIITEDVRRLERRLMLLRQYVLGHEPAPVLDQALLDVETARRAVKDRVERAGETNRKAFARPIQSVDAAIAQARKALQKAR